MVKIAILYPNGEGNTFDMHYYATKHMPMCAELFGSSMRAMEIDKGVAGRTSEDEVPYLAAGYFSLINFLITKLLLDPMLKRSWVTFLIIPISDP